MTRQVDNLVDLSCFEAGIGLQVHKVAVMDIVAGCGYVPNAGQPEEYSTRF